MNAKHAYLIMAHNNWELLLKLLQLLDDSRNDIFLHIDKKAKGFPREKALGLLSRSNIYLTKQFDIVWGSSQMMACELNMLYEARQHERYVYYHLLSGADLPIKTQDEIHSLLDATPDIEYIGFQKDQQAVKALLDRVKYYYFGISYLGKRENLSNIKKILWRIQDYSILIQKKIGICRCREYEQYKGSQWFSVSDKFVSILLKESEYLKTRYRHTMNADEHFLQNTAVKYQDELNIGDSHNRFIIWKNNSNSPEIIKTADWDQMMNSGRLFARKFDPAVDNEVILRLYNLEKRS